jgi:hypothetical protein
MDIIALHQQSKYDKQKKNKTALTQCIVELLRDGDVVGLRGAFTLNYDLYNKPRHIVFHHTIEINMKSGDIETLYEIENVNLTKDNLYRNCHKRKKNDFKQLLESIEGGFVKGEKRKNFWGVKYDREIESIFIKLMDILRGKFKSPFYKSKTTHGASYNNLFEIIVDFHLDMKGIKAHDNIYNDIQFEYPKKKWLELNEYKFLPAVLDSYGLKSKYLTKELNVANRNVQIKTINYFSKLFGDDYTNYLKKIPWQQYAYDMPPNKRTHTLKNEYEKECMVNVIINWEKQNIKVDNLITTLNRLLTVRKDLEDRGVELKFKAKNDNDFDTLMEIWFGYKKYLSRGFKLRYNFPMNFVKTIETPIHIDDSVYYLKVLKSEEDFMMEGYKMKNCMAKQFIHGVSYTYITLRQNRTSINLQYRKGALVQSFGKANTPTKDKFGLAIEELNKRFANYPEVFGIKEKYDFLTL